MAVEGLGWRKVRNLRFSELQCAMQKTAWPSRIYNKTRLDVHITTGTNATQLHPIMRFDALRQMYFIQIFSAESLGLLQEKKVEVGPIPVSVRDSVVQTRRNQQLTASVCPGRLRL